jgi:hypothetical protein
LSDPGIQQPFINNYKNLQIHPFLVKEVYSQFDLKFLSPANADQVVTRVVVVGLVVVVVGLVVGFVVVGHFVNLLNSS